MNKMLYLISGRNTYSDQLSRKFFEMKKCFEQIIDVQIVSGGDFQRQDRNSYHHSTLAEYNSKWYRNMPFFKSLAESVAEFRNIRHTIQTYNYLKQINSDISIIWERSSGLHWAGILFAKKNNIPSVLEWKDHLIKDYWSFFKPFSKFIEKWKNKNATFIVVESKVLKEYLISKGVNSDKIYVAYNAVNPEEFKKDFSKRDIIRSRFGVSLNDIVVGYVGSYAYYHDSLMMIKAADLLRQKGHNNIKWLLVGDGKDKQLCEQYSMDKDLINKYVFFVPSVPKEDVPYYLSAMDIAILPGSTDIICPIKVMEYMATELVVLVPDYQCNREIINNENGLLFTPHDERSIACQIVSMEKDRNLMSSIGVKAREYVSDNLIWSKTYGKVLNNIIQRLSTNDK